MLKLFLTVLFLFLINTLQARQTDIYNNGKSLISDFDEFVDTLQSYHPALYAFTPKNEFDNTVSRLRNEIDSTTNDKDFIWILSELIALVGCSHTALGFFNQQSDLLSENEYFPLSTRLIDDKLYVIDSFINNGVVKIGDEITHINGNPIPILIENIFNHITSQALIRTSKKQLFNVYNTSFLAYATNFPKNYTIKVKGNEKKITLNHLSEMPSYPPLFSKTHPCQINFCLNELDKETALLTVRNFAYYGEKTKIFTDFLDSSFNQINEKNYQKLIIDLRGNLGGPSDASAHILMHTLQKPFTYFGNNGTEFNHNNNIITPFKNNFKGSLFVLIDGEGNSSVGQLASIFKEKNRALFIGETLGSNQFATANQKRFQLTNTRISFTVARNIFITDVTEKNKSARIEPDYKIAETIDDFLSNRDIVLQKAFEIIKKN